MNSTHKFTLTIASGQTVSDSASVHLPRRALGISEELHISAPAALTGTVTVEVAPDDEAPAGDFRQLSVAGADLTIAAGDSVLVPCGSCRDLRLVSSSAEAAARAFVITLVTEL